MSKIKWWQEAVFYQIYPRSFADGNGDGIGDILGIIKKLPYLKDLGINAIWLSPHFPSPNWDCGYDISDYEAVASEYGDINLFKKFLAAVHNSEMHVIIDLVLNHTSNEHPWFLESSSSRDNPKSEWYVWRDPEYQNGFSTRNPPNNWQSCFDGSAWTYMPERDQFYYHYFMKQQPDLNWDNTEVKQAMWHIVRFWLDLGVDGFRLDAIGTVFEDHLLTPHPVPFDLTGLRYLSSTAKTHAERSLVAQYWQDMFKYQLGKPGIHDLMKELRKILDEYPGDKLLVGEDDNIAYLGNGNDELNLVFNFPLMNVDKITPSHVRNNQTERLSQLKSLPIQGWGCNTLGNHDCSRSINRYGDGVHNDQIARLNITLLLTLPGTPFLYYGEEIGMSDLILTNPDSLRDTMASWYYSNLVDELSINPEEAIKIAAMTSRDKNRTPMQWTGDPNAGFCPELTSPWLPVNPNFADGINVEHQLKDPSSLFYYYRNLCWLRRKIKALIVGEYIPVHENQNVYLSFLRKTEFQTILIVLNYSDKDILINFTGVLPKSSGRILFGQNQDFSEARMEIKAFEVCLADISFPDLD